MRARCHAQYKQCLKNKIEDIFERCPDAPASPLLVLDIVWMVWCEMDDHVVTPLTSRNEGSSVYGRIVRNSGPQHVCRIAGSSGRPMLVLKK